nr:hypothetical protein BaRGS_034607 [Batillaria attramentaria]
MRLGESFDGGQSTKEVTGNRAPFFPFNRQLSVSMESSELLRQQHRQPPTSMRSNINGSLPASSHGTNINFSLPVTSQARVPESSSSGSTVESDDISDSAIDKGENCDLTGRVHELEKELISSKCELAKVMNRQACYTEILKQKDEIILDLDEKLSKLGGADMGYDSKKRSVQASKEHLERIRILQNQNRFLNEEVRRLARLRSQEQTKIRDQDSRVHVLEGDIELWKLQYVSLIQSSIRFTGTDTMDDAELSLYGGDRHKNKVKSLLDEARKINPSLPTYENLAAGEVHVDYHGFKHQFHDTGLLLHYLCQELTQHYLSQAASQEQHQQSWNQYMRNNPKNLMKNRKELKWLCRGGVPDVFRRTVWRGFVHDQVSDLMVEKGPHYYRSLCSMLPDSPLAARYRKQISLDLMRTMPSNIKFSTAGSKGIMDLQDVLLAFCVHNPNMGYYQNIMDLQDVLLAFCVHNPNIGCNQNIMDLQDVLLAFCVHNPNIGYCQGMNFLVAMALLFMDAQDAFWTLVAVTERYHSVSYFDQNLLGAQADQSVLRDLLGDLLPNLARHLEAIDIEISTVTLNWFLAIFFDAVPFP